MIYVTFPPDDSLSSPVSIRICPQMIFDTARPPVTSPDKIRGVTGAVIYKPLHNNLAQILDLYRSFLRWYTNLSAFRMSSTCPSTGVISPCFTRLTTGQVVGLAVSVSCPDGSRLIEPDPTA